MKIAAVVAALAAASSAQAYQDNDLIIGFTAAGSTGDLVVDLGQLSSFAVAGVSVDLTAQTGFGSKSAFLAAMEAVNPTGTMNNLSWGVVGSHFVNSTTGDIYTTVLSQKPANAGVYSLLNAQVGTAAAIIGAGTTPVGYPANAGTEDPTLGNLDSWSETIANAAGTGGRWVVNFGNPNSKTPASFTTSQNAELFFSTITGSVVDEGHFTLGSDGSLSFTGAVVPEPSTYGLLGGIGLLALSLRRQLVRKES